MDAPAASLQGSTAPEAGLSWRAADSGGYPAPDLQRLGTADLADLFVGNLYDLNKARAGGGEPGPRVQVLAPSPPFRDFGATARFSGRIATVQCFESNLSVRAALSEPGQGRVLVVDAGASPRAALVGDNLAALAIKNGWTGVLLNGFLRDVACLATMELGIKALGTYPVKSGRRDWGVQGEPVHFGGVTFRPGDYLYSDEDGVLVSDTDLIPLAAAQLSA